MDHLVEIDGLVKTFGRTRALDGLELRVREGEVHGFLGPNGAGKSTTLRVLLGLLRADSGTVRLLGGDPWHDAAEWAVTAAAGEDSAKPRGLRATLTIHSAAGNYRRSCDLSSIEHVRAGSIRKGGTACGLQ